MLLTTLAVASLLSAQGQGARVMRAGAIPPAALSPCASHA
jgi:hypothetical protein